MKKMLLTAASAALVLASVGSAHASSAQALSLSNAPRASTAAGESNEIRGGFLLPLAIIVAVIIGVVLLTDDEPDSH